MQNSRPRRRVWGTVVTTVDRPSNSIGVATRRDRRGCSRKTECCTRLRCQGRVEFPDIHSGRIESEGFEFSTASREIDCVVPESGSSEYRISERERLNDLVVAAGAPPAIQIPPRDCENPATKFGVELKTEFGTCAKVEAVKPMTQPW